MKHLDYYAMNCVIGAICMWMLWMTIYNFAVAGDYENGWLGLLATIAWASGLMLRIFGKLPK